MTKLPILQAELEDLQRQFIDVYSKGGQVSIYMDAVRFLSGMHSTLEHMLRELTENSIDALASEIVVEISPDRIEVIDNGNGLNPFLTKDDIDMLAAYFEILNQGNRRPGEDIDKLGGEGSKKSLGWMNYMVLKSQKRLDPRSHQKGVMGAGFQVVRQLAGRIVVTSKATSALARNYFTQPEDSNDPLACKMILPTSEEFERAQIHPRFEFVEPAKTHIEFGHYASGTRVHLSDLRPGMIDRLNIDSLLHILSTAHGVDIRKGISIKVIDRFTPIGRRTAGGVVHNVSAPSYKGRLVISKMLVTRSSHKPFNVEIYVCGEKEVGDKICLRRHDSDVSILSETSLQELRTAPWNSKRLSGWIAFPEVEESQAPWNAAKTEPLESPTRNQWLKVLTQQLAPEIEDAIKKLDEELKTTNSNQGAKVVADAFNQALSQIPELGNFHQGNEPGTGGGKGTGTKHTDVVEDRVFVKVVDQYNQGVTGVTIELLTKRNSLLDSFVTGGSGEHSFGVRDSGNYRLRFLLPAGMAFRDELYEGNLIAFQLPTKVGKGIRIYLSVIVDNAQPPSLGKSQRPKNYEVVFGPLPSRDIVYDSSLIHFGKLVVNQSNAEVAEVYRKGNQVANAALLAHCLTSAVGELSEERLPGYSVQERAQLLARLYTSTMSALSSRLR